MPRKEEDKITSMEGVRAALSSELVKALRPEPDEGFINAAADSLYLLVGEGVTLADYNHYNDFELAVSRVILGAASKLGFITRSELEGDDVYEVTPDVGRILEESIGPVAGSKRASK